MEDLPQDKDSISSALCVAASSGETSMVRKLIEAGADINYKESGLTALLWASNQPKSSLDILKMLIEAGADLNASGPLDDFEDLWTPLMLAVGKGDMEMLNLLVASGAHVNYQNDYGETALTRAVRFPYKEGSVEIAQALIDAGADVNTKYPNVAREEEIGWTPLMKALATGHKEMCQLLLAAGPDLSYRNPKGQTALLMAIIYDSGDDAPEIVKSLIDAGADVNVSAEWNEMTFTPLMHAAEAEEKELCKILIAAWAKTVENEGAGWGEATKQKIKEFLANLE